MEYGKAGLRQFITAFVFIGIVSVLFALNLIIKPPEVLVSERRKPAEFPELTIGTVASGSFMDKFEGYAADHFVFRDGFRAIRAFTVLDVLMMTDKSGVYRSENVGVGEFKSIDADAYVQSAEKIRKVAESPQLEGLNIYYTIVPDKSIFAERYMPGFDPAQAEELLSSVLADLDYIRLIGTDALGADSYYRTDLHWNQAEIAKAVELLSSEMGVSTDISGYSKETAGDFSGVYAGHLALPVPPDSLSYLTLPTLSASYLNDKTLQFEPGPVYDLERFKGIDPYDIFMCGPQPIVVLENKNATTQRELYIFRDSFGSSLAPLMANSYSKITLIDLRYINWSIVDQFVQFEPGSDVLFIYSSQILNNPSTLQVQ